MSENKQLEIASMRRVLSELSSMAEEASLTGSLRGGEGRAVARYNAILARMTEFDEIPTGMYQPLPSTAGFGDLAVESRFLAAHLDEVTNGVYGPDSKNKHKNKNKGGPNDPGVLIRLAPFVDSEDLAHLVRDMMRSHANFDMNLLTALAPFMDKSLLGELLRKHAWDEAPEAPEAPEPPAPAAPQTPQPQPEPRPQPEPVVHEWDSRLAASPETQPAKTEDLLELLKNPHLSEYERSELVQKLAESVAPK